MDRTRRERRERAPRDHRGPTLRRLVLAAVTGAAAILGLSGCAPTTPRAGGHERRMFPSPTRGFTLGADISPINLLPGQAGEPSGPALITELKADHIRLVRLVAETPTPLPALAQLLHHGGWSTVFGELDRARIGAVLLLGGEAGPDGTFAAGHWPAEPPTPGFPAPGQRVETTTQWIANEAAIIADITAQCGGLPPSLVGIEVANEPLLDAATLPMVARAIAAAHRDAPGVPVTIGGWRAPARQPGERWDYNDPADTAEVARLVDFLSVHLYPGDIARLPAGAGRTATDPATYLPIARAFLQHVIAAAGGKPIMVGEFGAIDGRPETVPFQPAGGSMAQQAAVIQAVTEAMVDEAGHGVTGGTVWLFEQDAGAGFPCTPWCLLCFGRPPTPAVHVLAAAAAADDRGAGRSQS